MEIKQTAESFWYWDDLQATSGFVNSCFTLSFSRQVRHVTSTVGSRNRSSDSMCTKFKANDKTHS